MLPVISLPLPRVLLLIFLIMCGMTIVLSCILIYHWRAYGESNTLTGGTTVVYLLGAALLLGGMFSAVTLTL